MSASFVGKDDEFVDEVAVDLLVARRGFGPARWLFGIHFEEQLPENGAGVDIRDAVICVISIVAREKSAPLIVGGQSALLCSQTVPIHEGRIGNGWD